MSKADILFNNSYPRIVGILNVTPDSFYDGGQNFNFQDAVNRVAVMVRAGADAVDIGGESTRPGSKSISLKEELSRVIPVIEAVSKRFDICISIDTQKVEVAKEAFRAGAHIINDVSGLSDEKMIELAADYDIPVIIMHMHGKTSTMHMTPVEGDVIDVINEFFQKKIEQCKEAGIKRYILDPGIGFGKNHEQNLIILNNLPKFKREGVPLMIGHSNKSFIGRITGREFDARVFGTSAVTALAVYNGADVIRAHEIVASRDAAVVAQAINEERINPDV